MQKILIWAVALLAILFGVIVGQRMQSDFSTLDDQDYRWQNSQEQWTVVNYFAQWCAPCLREIPELNHFYQQNQQQVRVYAISFDTLPSTELLALKEKYAIGYPIITELANMPWQQPPSSLPTTYILNPEGQVQKQLKGELSAEELWLTIQQLKAL